MCKVFCDVTVFRFAALVLIGLASYGQMAFAEIAGRIEFASAGVMIQSSDGTTKVASKGLDVMSGDSLDTGAGRVQMRMVDGAFFSLQPNTQFKLDDYALNKIEPAKERSYVSLLKGGLRSITGLIGKNNRKNYKLSTPTATIGIRGTDFGVTSNEKGDTFSVSSGGISVCNTGGCQDVNPGETAFSPNQNTKPVLTVAIPIGGVAADVVTNKPDVSADRVISTDIVKTPAPTVTTPSYTPPTTAPPPNTNISPNSL